MTEFTTIDEAVCAHMDKKWETRPSDYWIASQAGYCMRKQYLKRLGTQGEETVVYKNRMQAFDGDGIHAKIQGAFKDLGILIEAEVPIIDDELHFKGKPDAVVRLVDGLCIMDIKTENQKAWARRTVKKQRVVNEHHRKQVLYYYYFLRKHRYPELATARLYYINRNSGEREEFLLNFSEEEIKAAINELVCLNEYMELKVEPDKTTDLIQCQFCPYAKHCYGGPPPKPKYFN